MPNSRQAGEKSRLHVFTRLVTSLLLIFAALMLVAGRTAAGPPWVTDDPEPVDYLHWEIFLSSIYQHGIYGSFGTLPHVELNYGPAPNVQVAVMLPTAFSTLPGGPMLYGLGDIELGLKYRFVQESKKTPMVSVYPQVVVPTGDTSRGLGQGHLQTFLPVWLQKSWGAWTAYGGGGYWINPGVSNRNFWQFGWLLQKDLNKHWTLGGELYYFSSTAAGIPDEFGFNVGGQYNIDEGHHLILAIGRNISGTTDFMTYFGHQWTFGPHGKDAPEGPGEKAKD